MIFLIPAMILAFYAQAKVSSTFRRYSSVHIMNNMTGAEAARRILDLNGLSDVAIEAIRGNLTDHYDPTKKVLRLSESVYRVSSISAVSVACHEAGHAIQHSKEYLPLKLRGAIVPVANIASKLTWPLILIGVILMSNGNLAQGDFIFNIGVIVFSAVILFHLVTLPVEFDASSRAIDQMVEYSIVDSTEVRGAKRVLRAAALTYVAALAMAIANLLRILAMRDRN